MAGFDEQLNALLSDPESMSRIMALAQSLSAPSREEDAPPSAQAAAQPPPRQTSSAGGGDLLSALSSGSDTGVLLRLLPLIRELGGSQDTNARRLLYALQPYLRPERQAKVDRALQLARLFHVGRRLLATWEVGGDV